MGKIAHNYLKVDEWEIIEKNFDIKNGRVSESIFSLGNEYMGVRGYFDEGYGGDRLIGSYLNGVIEKGDAVQPNHYKGMVRKVTYMVNTVDWLYTRISIDGEILDLYKSKFSKFIRKLDMKNGELIREFIWETSTGKLIKITFKRFLSIVSPKVGCQQIIFKALNFSGKLQVRSGLDFSPIHEAQDRNLWICPLSGKEGTTYGILGKTQNSGHKILSAFQLHRIPEKDMKLFEEEKIIGLEFEFELKKDIDRGFEKIVVNHSDKNEEKSIDKVWHEGIQKAKDLCSNSYNNIFEEHSFQWNKIWKNSDITIDGDPYNQQGIRYCIYQLHQTYHGTSPLLNIGAKGLTGEAYSGNAFWDTEVYCLPFYIFNNPRAAKNLIEFRYNTLSNAIERARSLDCEGAFYPIATNDGTECCSLWQHASLQLQASTAVAYAIWNYDKHIMDKEFLYSKGIEMLLQISRMLASRGQYGQKIGKYGFYAVMGPDEFQMMVNNNFYTNMMGKKTLEYTLDIIEEMKSSAPELLISITDKMKITEVELNDWRFKAENMYIPQDKVSGIYEQHEGYFNLPHIDVDSIPVEEFPLYNNWSYDRIYRNDMIKQPDVLMYMFMYNQEFSMETKRVNYEYYEPRCIHESSLSPSIHSIFASDLGRYDEAYDFFKFATRMDLDNYNRNTEEGLHITSIAAAWMNIVYGFGGMRSDGEILSFSPTIPDGWNSFSFKILNGKSLLNIKVDKENVIIEKINGPASIIKLYGKICEINENYTAPMSGA